MLWSCIVSWFELKFSLRQKDQYEEGLGQASDRIHELFRQQPWREYTTVLLLGHDSVEAIHFPASPGADILRTGLLPLFSKANSKGDGAASAPLAPGMQLLF